MIDYLNWSYLIDHVWFIISYKSYHIRHTNGIQITRIRILNCREFKRCANHASCLQSRFPGMVVEDVFRELESRDDSYTVRCLFAGELSCSLSGNSAEAWRVQFSKVPVPPKTEKQQNLWPPSVTVIFLPSCTDIESNWMTFFATTSKVLENSLTSLYQTIIWNDRFERKSGNSLKSSSLFFLQVYLICLLNPERYLYTFPQYLHSFSFIVGWSFWTTFG